MHHQFAALTEDFRDDIVTVDSLPRILDHPQRSILESQKGGRSVDITELGRILTEPGSTPGTDGFYFAHQKPSQINLVNHLVQEKAATGFEIFSRRRSRIPTNCSELVDASDQVPIDLAASLRITRVKPTLETNLERNPALIDDLERFLRPF